MTMVKNRSQSNRSPDNNTTPVMEQYIEIKAANPGSLLFYRMGDFYELFFDDAEEASRALGIVLTFRGKHQGMDVPMCGVPVTRANEHLNRLIQLGYRVAIAEQLEDPEEARKRGSKAIVRRDVVRLITPGTLTEEALLDPGRPNHLLSIVRVSANGRASPDYGIAWLDLSTGSFKVAAIKPDRLISEIDRINPVEIVLPDDLFHDQRFQKSIKRAIEAPIVPSYMKQITAEGAERLITDWYGPETLSQFKGLFLSEQEASLVILSYVKHTQRGTKAHLEFPTRDQLTAVMHIDVATRFSLELMRTQTGERRGSLMDAVDKTVTPLGRRLLAERISSPSTDCSVIQRRQDAVRRLYDDTSLTQSIRDILKSAPDILRSLTRLALDRGEPRDLAAIREGLEVTGKIGELLKKAQDLPEELEEMRKISESPLQSLVEDLKRALNPNLPSHRREGGIIATGYDENLDKNRDLSVDFRKHIAQLEARYCAESGIKTLRIKHNNILGFFIDLSVQNGERLLASQTDGKFIHRQTLVSAMRFTTLELSDMDSQIKSAQEQALARELELFSNLVERVLAEEGILRLIANCLSRLDVSAGWASLARSENWCQPKVEDSLVLNITAGRHPVVERFLKLNGVGRFVSNHCDLSPVDEDEYGRLVILTGPNMGGKSTWLRQNALIVLLAQIGAFVPATSARIGIVDRLFSRVGASDDLARGNSTFMLEMLETASIIKQASPKSLVVFDEIGRGTATFDGLSIACGVVEYLVEVNKCRAIFATHYHELTQLVDRFRRIENHTVTVKEWGKEVTFLHRVVPGVADRSYGIHVARLAGLPDVVLERARNILEQLERDKSVSIQTPAYRQSEEEKEESDTSAGGSLSGCGCRVVEQLERISPDELSPREALDELYYLKGLLE